MPIAKMMAKVIAATASAANVLPRVKRATSRRTAEGSAGRRI